MTTMDETAVTTQVYRVYIKATPQAIWDAITKPEWTQRYGYRGRVEFDLRPGGKYRIARADRACRRWACRTVIVDGEVVEADPPRKLVQTWRPLWDPETRGGGLTRVTWEIERGRRRRSRRLTVTHELEGAPKHRGAGRRHGSARRRAAAAGAGSSAT